MYPVPENDSKDQTRTVLSGTQRAARMGPRSRLRGGRGVFRRGGVPHPQTATNVLRLPSTGLWSLLLYFSKHEQQINALRIPSCLCTRFRSTTARTMKGPFQGTGSPSIVSKQHIQFGMDSAQPCGKQSKTEREPSELCVAPNARRMDRTDRMDRTRIGHVCSGGYLPVNCV